jgi:hypothetical protein
MTYKALGMSSLHKCTRRGFAFACPSVEEVRLLLDLCPLYLTPPDLAVGQFP